MSDPDTSQPIAGRPHAPTSYAFSSDGAGKLPWAHAEERLEGAHVYWIATTRPDGRAHVSPLWGTWVDGALYLDGHPQTTWARNLRANPAASIHLESGSDVVILECSVEDINTDEDLGTRIVAAWHDKYGKLDPDPVGSGIFRFRPDIARAWSESSLTDGTRWEFRNAAQREKLPSKVR